MRHAHPVAPLTSLSWLVHRDTEEGKRILAEREAAKLAAERAAEEKSMAQLGDAQDAEVDTKQLRNQFNFSERASQTFNNPLRVQRLV